MAHVFKNYSSRHKAKSFSIFLENYGIDLKVLWANIKEKILFSWENTTVSDRIRVPREVRVG